MPFHLHKIDDTFSGIHIHSFRVFFLLKFIIDTIHSLLWCCLVFSLVTVAHNEHSYYSTHLSEVVGKTSASTSCGSHEALKTPSIRYALRMSLCV